MKRLNKFLSIVLCLAMITGVFAISGTASAATKDKSDNALTSAGASADLTATGDDYWTSSVNADKFSWDNASVYFMLTDRFYNGNTSNDHSYTRGLNKNGSVATSMKSQAGMFQGGDFVGVTKKITEGYFDDLGVNALWISAPYEQIQGYVCAGDGKSSFPHYAYHGYYAGDYSKFDANFGTAEEFQTLVDTAHEHGIRIVLDIVMNHPGYNTMYDMDKYSFGQLKSGWDTNYYSFAGNATTYHQFIQYTGGATAWLSWWGKDWLRAGLSGYDNLGNDEITGSAGGSLPDFKTENQATVGIPQFLQKKWTQEGTLSTNQTNINNWMSQHGKSKIVRNYLCYWLSQYVEKYGVDGFRCDTAKHVEMASWKALSDTCTEALNTWRKNNKGKVGADWTDDFWMTGENYGQGVSYNNYYTSGGFESMINFSFTGGGGVPGSSQINNTYNDYANKINTNDKFNVLTYISSHDTKLCGRNENSTSSNQGTLLYQGSAFQLLPGGIQIYYGDECARPYVYETTSQSLIKQGNHDVRSFMNWNNQDKTVLAHWQKVGQFRNNHVAVGAGSHKSLSATSGTAFQRVYNKNGVKDKVIACIAANKNQNVTITVDSTYFKDGIKLKNTYTGDTASVSGGKVTVNSGAQGTILLEVAEDAKIYNVTNTLTNVTTNNNAKEATENTAYKATLTPATGYDLGTVRVTMGGTDVTSSVYSNGNINISSVTGDIAITASGNAKSFKVQSTLRNATSSNSAASVNYGSAYTTTIKPNSGYKMTSVVVMMNNAVVTSSVYNSSTGVISIPNVNGDVFISAIATAIPTSSSSQPPQTSSSSEPPTSSSSQPPQTSSSSEPQTSSSSQPPQTSSSSEPQTSSSSQPPVTGTTESKPTETWATYVPAPQPTVTVPEGEKILYGDVDLNGTVNIRDVTLAQKYLSKATELSSQQILAANVNKNSGVDIRDVTLIQKYVSGMSDTDPVGQVIPGTEPLPTQSQPTQSQPTQSQPTQSQPQPVQEFAVINSLINAKSDNSAETVKEGSSYRAVLTPDAGYEISTVIASNGDDTIDAVKMADGSYLLQCTVKGDIVITCIAVEQVTPPTPTSSESTATNPTESTDTSSESQPTSPTQGGDTVTITLADGTPEVWLADGEAVFEIVDNATGTKYPMEGGAGTWTATIPKSVTDITFNRNSPETGETWNTWATTVQGTTYTATSSGVGNWTGDTPGPGPGPEPTPTGTVKFTDNQGWGTVYAYFYSTEWGTVGGAEWPGTQMTADGDNGYGQTNYSIDIPEGAEYVIFNNDKDQTGNIALTGEEGYYTDGTRDSEGHLVAIPWSGGDDPNPGPDPGPGPEPTPSGTVQFTDNQGWGTVYAYFYSTEWGTIGGAEWPGTAMTNAGDNGFGQTNFTIDIPEGAEFVVFNNGSGDQTVDVPLGHAGYYTDGTRENNKLTVQYWD